MIVSEPSLFVAAQQHLTSRGLLVPKDISMVCLDYDPLFAWCDPPISHIHWNSQSVVRRVARWANTIARGKSDCRKTWIAAEFIEGGTIGPASKAW